MIEEKVVSAKEYLMQVQILDTKIQQKLEESAQLQSLVLGRGMQINAERVQTSPANTQESTIVKYIDIEHRIDQMVDAYIDLKDRIIDQIHSISGKDADKYIRLLFDHYVPDGNHRVKSLEQISVAMNYNYTYTCELHGRALKEFERILKEPNFSEVGR